jgi:hypothetical protein
MSITWPRNDRSLLENYLELETGMSVIDFKNLANTL